MTLWIYQIKKPFVIGPSSRFNIYLNISMRLNCGDKCKQHPFLNINFKAYLFKFIDYHSTHLTIDTNRYTLMWSMANTYKLCTKMKAATLSPVNSEQFWNISIYSLLPHAPVWKYTFARPTRMCTKSRSTIVDAYH